MQIIPILLVFLPVFSVAAAATESRLCVLHRALKTNKNPASYGEIIYFQGDYSAIPTKPGMADALQDML